MKQSLDGALLADFIKERQAKQVRNLRQQFNIIPKLVIVTDYPSKINELYTRLKQRYGADILVDVEIKKVETAELVDTIDELNNRDDVQGIIVQLPLKNTSITDETLSQLSPEKDVDGLHPKSSFSAATPMAINWLLTGYNVNLADKKIAIVGRGKLVGAPLEQMWKNSGLDVDVFEKGDDLSCLKNYEIIVAATGVPALITPEMISQNAVAVDAGVASESGKIVGDIAPEVRERGDIIITPEKGGVGPLTVAALFDNVINACYKRKK